jgi:hypothetical protein
VVANYAASDGRISICWLIPSIRKSKTEVGVRVKIFGRHERTRTADPYRVKVVLYQLSYVPKDKTRSRIVYFGEEPKVTKRLIQCQAGPCAENQTHCED